MQNVMWDLETLGKVPGAPIVSIGAVFFDPDTDAIGETFYRVIDLSVGFYGLKLDNSTLAWWLDQSSEAFSTLRQALKGGEGTQGLYGALNDLSGFMKFGAGGKDVFPWGCGSDFDNAILAYAYAHLGFPYPAEFWNNRCFRTLKNLLRSVNLPAREGTHHNALDDAIYQAKCANVLLRRLKDMKTLASACGWPQERPAVDWKPGTVYADPAAPQHRAVLPAHSGDMDAVATAETAAFTPAAVQSPWPFPTKGADHSKVFIPAPAGIVDSDGGHAD